MFCRRVCRDCEVCYRYSVAKSSHTAPTSVSYRNLICIKLMCVGKVHKKCYKSHCRQLLQVILHKIVLLLRVICSINRVLYCSEVRNNFIFVVVELL